MAIDNRNIYKMTPADLVALEAGASNPNAFFDHFFRKAGSEQAWNLDRNFTDEGKWQEDMCLAAQAFIVVIAGIGTGKSLGVVMSAAYHAVQTKGFKFLNVAKESWQSKLMYEALVEQSKDTLFEKLITAKPKRPYPLITLEFMIGEVHYQSTMEFMSLGEDKDATNIFSWRGDWINIEEAGRIDNLSEITSNLWTRLTGVTADGRPFLGRMTLISNPWDNPDLWQLFDMAASDAEDGLAFNIDTKDNMNVTERQRRIMLKNIDKDQHERFTTGKRPEGNGLYFTMTNIRKGVSKVLTEQMRIAFKGKQAGFDYKKLPHIGVYDLQMPRKDGRMYFMLGDPGTGNAPSRNAPVWMVWDVTDAPKTCNLVGFWWGTAGGSIMPFINRGLEWIDYYKPTFAGVDNTSTQKNTAELVNLEYVTGKNKSVDAISGLDFSGSKRYSYLTALKMSLERGAFQWPHIVLGIASQLGNYDPIKDRSTSSKLAQDIVATMAMSAFVISCYYGYFDENNDEADEAEDEADKIIKVLRRNIRRTRQGPGRSGPIARYPR